MAIYNIRRRPYLVAFLSAVVAQLLFTLAIRSYVVPHLLPHSHWRFGLQQLSDSQFFYERAIQVTRAARAGGVGLLYQDAGDQLRHTQILALIFYVTASDNPFPIYAFNALLAGVSAWLLCIIASACGVSGPASARLAVALGLSPQFLYLHSELLREPFILPPLQLAWLGCVLFVFEARSLAGRQWPRLGMASAAMISGFTIASTFRPYLMLPLLVALSLVLVISAVWRLVTHLQNSAWRGSHATYALVLIFLAVGFVAPLTREVQEYGETGGEGTPFATLSAEKPQARFDRRILPHASAPVSAEDLRRPHACSVHWQKSGLLPDRVERALESLSCARDDFLQYCDPQVYGTRIDRGCDTATVSSAHDIVRHLPHATMYALLTPFPNMWFDSFGAGGTGMRRVGYVVDGVLSYLLLPGLVGLLVAGPGSVRAWPLAFVAVGITAAITVYAFAVPTQFIFSRMRVGFYRPLLVLAAAGWLRLLGAWWGGSRSTSVRSTTSVQTNVHQA